MNYKRFTGDFFFFFSGVQLTCDSSNNFRNIDGTCNNVKYPYLGAMSTPFTREIQVDEYNPKNDLTVYDDEGSSFQGIDYTRSDRKGGKKGGKSGKKGGNGGKKGKGKGKIKAL